MNFENLEPVTDTKGDDASATLTSFSLEFSQPPSSSGTNQKIELAEAAGAEKGEGVDSSDNTGDSTSDKGLRFTELDKDGPLGEIIRAGDSGPSALIKPISEADEAWQEQYKRLTEIDGHRLVDRHDNAFAAAREELSMMPSLESSKIMRTAEKYLDPNAEITEEMEAEMAQYPRLHAACKTLHETAGNPNLEEARQLQGHVRENLDESIKQRERFAEFATADENRGKRLVNGMNMTTTSLVLGIEKNSLIRYSNGGWR